LEDEDLVETALTALALRLDGKAAAATVARRKRAVFFNVLDAASTGKGRVLSANPLVTMKWKPPQAAEKIDRRVVCNPRQARELLTMLSYVGGLDRDRAAAWSPCSRACTSPRCVRPKRSTCARQTATYSRRVGAAFMWLVLRPRSASGTPIAASCTTKRA
jgi:hypothetical protein